MNFQSKLFRDAFRAENPKDLKHESSPPTNCNIATSETSDEQYCLLLFNNVLQKFAHSPELCWEIEKLVCQYGVPNEKRALVWGLLLSYIPTNQLHRKSELLFRRQRYIELIGKHCNKDDERDPLRDLIRADVTRTHPREFVTIYQTEAVQQAFIRLLYVWSKENPQIRYFQGLNDLAVPFFTVFLTSCFGRLADTDIQQSTVWNQLDRFIHAIEADTYWCLSKLLDALQCQVVFTNRGLHAEHMIDQFKALTSRAMPLIHHKLEELGVHFSMFSFRWILCFMGRELSIKNQIVLWDYYISNGPSGFASVHIYFCCVFLESLSGVILDCTDFGSCLTALQSNTTQFWTPLHIKAMVDRAKFLQTVFPL